MWIFEKFSSGWEIYLTWSSLWSYSPYEHARHCPEPFTPKLELIIHAKFSAYYEMLADGRLREADIRWMELHLFKQLVSLMPQPKKWALIPRQSIERFGLAGVFVDGRHLIKWGNNRPANRSCCLVLIQLFSWFSYRLLPYLQRVAWRPGFNSSYSFESPQLWGLSYSARTPRQRELSRELRPPKLPLLQQMISSFNRSMASLLPCSKWKFIAGLTLNIVLAYLITFRFSPH